MLALSYAGTLYALVDYSSEIQPIFDNSCISCHADGGTYFGGLDLSSYSDVMEGGNSGNVIVPFDYANSLLWQHVNSYFMPPYGSGNDILTTAQINLIAQWIDEGALESNSNLGCTDPEAYSCANDGVYTNYIFEAGGIMYDNSCNWDWNITTNQADYVGGCENEVCDGYYDPNATADDGSCHYYQAPNQEDVIFTEVDASTISLNWFSFIPPVNSVVVSYHVMRCTTEMCQWLLGFGPWDTNLDMILNDNYTWVPNIEIKYIIAVKYENNPYWGLAIGASYFTPGDCNPGDLNQNGVWNVLDIVTLVNCILDSSCSGCEGDLNTDGFYNVLDIVTLANCILGENCDGRRFEAQIPQLSNP